MRRDVRFRSIARRACAAVLLAGALAARAAAPARAQTAPEFVWLESEAPTTTNFPVAPDSWANAMSGDKWLKVSIDEADVEKKAPKDGVLIGYEFQAPAAGKYQAWDRLGFENIRSPFQWRVDDGEWKSVDPDEPTTDLMEIGFWASVAWYHLGDVDLTAGKHTLQFRLPVTLKADKKPRNILYVSDALCLTKGAFLPNGKYKPGDTSWQTERDRQAAGQVFQAAAPNGAAQTATPLQGVWQWARWDEPGLIANRTDPIATTPPAEELYWRSMKVPGNRNKELPDFTFAHRYFLRTRIQIPADQAGSRSFYLHIPSVNMIASVFVNGQLCGTSDTPFATFDCDITKAVKAGANDVWVGIKDVYYGFSPRDGKNARSTFMYPTDFANDNQGATMNLDFPVWNHNENGILLNPSLVSAGKAYTSDVFAIPSVRNKALGLEVTVRNSTGQALTAQVENEVVPLAGGAAEKTFAAKELVVPAGQEAVLKVTEAWANPKLWWPDDPQQYNVVTRVKLGGQVVDERKTKFGFREWEWAGPAFKLNGIPFHGRADLANYNRADDESIALWKKHGQNMQRLWAETETGGVPIEEALDKFDAQGMPIRRTGIFDGEAGKYWLVEDKVVNGKQTTVVRQPLFDHWRKQLVAWARSQRNHPSIFIWSMENEITFINSAIFGQNAITDPEVRKIAQDVMAMDPTRPVMTDGGNALLDESLPVYGGHYMEPSFTSLPNGAYDAAAFAHRQRWPITQVKPMLFGEAYFASGVELGTLAAVGGEAAFVGKAEAHPAMGLVGKMLSEGYRWNGVGFHFWLGGETDAYYNSWQPVAVLCRQWDWTFGSGQRVKRTLGVFNDTRFSDPITLTATLQIGGKTVETKTTTHNVPAGGNEKFDVTLAMPAVAARQEGTWTLTLTQKGKQVFKDVKNVSVLNVSAGHASLRNGGPVQTASLAPVAGGGGKLFVYDPSGGVQTFLKARGVSFSPLASLATLPEAAKVLLIGPNALDPATSTSSRLAAWAIGGHNLVVLEQKNPLRFQALPGDMRPDTNDGCMAFMEDAGHPVFKGLQQKDFASWGPDGVTYFNAYNKPTSGGKSLVQCEDSLKDTALAEMPAGKGILLLSQLNVGTKLSQNAVAQKLLLNMLDYAMAYKPTHRAVAFAGATNPQLAKAVDAMGVSYSKAADPLAAIARPGGIALIDANPASLKTLAANLPRVKQFTEGGGWIVLNNLTPEGLADYNKLVGYDHVIRPFKREKVTFPAVRSPLTAGLGTSSIVMYSGKQIFPWAAGQYTDEQAFSYVVDIDDIAPFCKSSFSSWDNIVNNFVGSDGWPLIINFPVDRSPYDIPIALPRQETVTQFTWVANNNYNPTTKIGLVFNGADKVAFDVKPTTDPQPLAITPARAAKQMTLQILDWQHLPGKQSDGKDLVGIDNIYIKVKRPADFYQKVRPMLNIGAMVEYPRGAGGLALCNVLFKDSEAVPENVEKKRTVLAAILRNLKAPFTGGKTIIAGASNLSYTPLDLSKQANAYRTEQGWFGDKNYTFKDLPTGKHTFAGVPYNVYDFATSPVPTAIMLGTWGLPAKLPEQVTGIPVGRKADALFFLQSARIDGRRNEREVRENRQYEMADYIIHYADGQTVKVPIYSEVSVENYRQDSPTAIAGAQIAWSKPYEDGKSHAVAYSMQWNNPRPNVAIDSIDLVYGPDRRGTPVLLALTAATAE